MKTLSTSQVCEYLGVSRSWVNNHLRKIGFKDPDIESDKANIRTVYYNICDIIEWFNKKATFTRQTKFIDLTDYVAETEILSENFLMPLNIHNACSRVHERFRGELNWVSVNYNIKSIDEIKALSTIQENNGYNNNEMAYRYIFNSGMIKAEICGRKWYINAPEKNLKHPVLVPADIDF